MLRKEIARRAFYIAVSAFSLELAAKSGAPPSNNIHTSNGNNTNNNGKFIFPDLNPYPSLSSHASYCESASSIDMKEPLHLNHSAEGCAFYPANHPIEDRHIRGEYDSWSYGGVFDGHGGHQVADFASKYLMDFVFKKLKNISSDMRDQKIIEQKIGDGITEAFNEIEDALIDKIKSAFQIGYRDVAKVGSCVLIALRKGNQLVIANCGDCRAVLGSREPKVYNDEKDLKVFATRINRDHNCREPLEKKKLENNHPNEENLVVCKNDRACYVKGRLQLTRSLGDAYLKYPEFNGNPSLGRAGGRHIPNPFTPPYVSHQPDVIHLTLGEDDRFVILGTDGLWDYLPDQDAVDIVNAGLKNKVPETEVAQRLVDKALEIAARESGMSYHQLKEIPPKQRRRVHDDTTAVVIYF